MIITNSATAMPAPTGNGQNSDWGPVEQAMGRSGTLIQGDIMKFSMPRSDLKVSIGNVTIAAALALGSWVAFKKAGNGTMAMVDLVLTESEVKPVIRALRDNGIEVTALHSHMLTEEPRLFFMHFWANDDANKLATGMRAALYRVNIKPEIA